MSDSSRKKPPPTTFLKLPSTGKLPEPMFTVPSPEPTHTPPARPAPASPVVDPHRPFAHVQAPMHTTYTRIPQNRRRNLALFVVLGLIMLGMGLAVVLAIGWLTLF
ncbi:MAG: hypothetical protein AAFV53_20065 [Myxococcota bacterium]